MAKILLVDDDEDHNKMVAAVLTRENYIVEVATTGDQAMSILTVSGFDLLIFDWQLPDTTGVELLRWYRQRGEAPVMMLTGKGTIDDREQGLDSGADDYLIKPFSNRELAARIRALLRRPSNLTDGLIAGDYLLNPKAYTVSKGDAEIRLPPREFALLELARHPNEVFRAEVLMSRVWRIDSEATTDTLRTAIKQIRKRLDENIIETVTGVGYKIRAPRPASSGDQ